MRLASSFRCLVLEIIRPSTVAFGLSVLTAVISIDNSHGLSTNSSMTMFGFGCVGSSGPIWCAMMR